MLEFPEMLEVFEESGEFFTAFFKKEEKRRKMKNLSIIVRSQGPFTLWRNRSGYFITEGNTRISEFYGCSVATSLFEEYMNKFFATLKKI